MTHHYRFQVTSWKDKLELGMDPTNSSYLITDQQFTMVGKDVFYRSAHNWLEYSPITDKMYCFVCRAFTALYAVHLDTQFPVLLAKWIQHSQWLVLKWKKATTLLSKHQNSLVHKQSALSYTDFLQSVPINHQLDQASARNCSRLQKQQETNREILYRIIDVILLLVKTGHPLRGHRENTDSHNRGLFLEITHLLAKYDEILKVHFEDGPRNATYTSMTRAER